MQVPQPFLMLRDSQPRATLACPAAQVTIPTASATSCQVGCARVAAATAAEARARVGSRAKWMEAQAASAGPITEKTAWNCARGGSSGFSKLVDLVECWVDGHVTIDIATAGVNRIDG